jgi:hypothetical protein
MRFKEEPTHRPPAAAVPRAHAASSHPIPHFPIAPRHVRCTVVPCVHVVSTFHLTVRLAT